MGCSEGCVVQWVSSSARWLVDEVRHAPLWAWECALGVVCGAFLLLGAVAVCYFRSCFFQARRFAKWQYLRGFNLVEDVGELSERHKKEVFHDFMEGRVYWSGNWAADFKFFLSNFHPVLAIFQAHPQNPYTPGKALLVLVLTLLFNVQLTPRLTWLLGRREELKDPVTAQHWLPSLDLHEHLCAGLAAVPATLLIGVLQQFAFIGFRVVDFRRQYRGRSRLCCCNCLLDAHLCLCTVLAEHLYWMFGLLCIALPFLHFEGPEQAGPSSMAELAAEVRGALSQPPTAAQAAGAAYVMAANLLTLSVLYPVLAVLNPMVFGPPRFCHRILRMPLACLQWYPWWGQMSEIEEETDWLVADFTHPAFGRTVFETTLKEVDEGGDGVASMDEASTSVRMMHDDPDNLGSFVGLVQMPDENGVQQCVKIERVRCDSADAYEEWLREKIWLQERIRQKEGDVTAEVRDKLMLRRQYQDSEVEHCLGCCGMNSNIRGYVEHQRAQRPILVSPTASAASAAGSDAASAPFSTALLGSGPRRSPSSGGLGG